MTDRELVLDVLARAGLGRFAAQVEGLIKPAIVATSCADEPIGLGASRFGGDPDLPAGAAWPHAWDAPMEFVAQVRLRDVAPHDVDRVLPAAGSLLFFYNSQWTTSFDERDGAPFECGRVVHVDEDAELVRTPAPQVEIEDEYGRRIAPKVYAPTALRFTPTLTVPNMGALMQGDDLAELRAVWDDFLDRHHAELPPTGSQMLGHLVQHDDVDAMSADDVLLFQIDSDPRPGFDWGKRYFLYFVAAAIDISNRDFSRVRVDHGICC